jgi:uncharacterized protein (TIGR00369 family)
LKVDVMPESRVDGFNELIGLVWKEMSPDGAVVMVDIDPKLHQAHGIVHGGVWCSIVEAAASVAGAMWLGDKGTCVGVSNQTNFIRAARSGTVVGTATPIHRGRTSQLWTVDVRDESGRLVARGEVRLQNVESTDSLGR